MVAEEEGEVFSFVLVFRSSHSRSFKIGVLVATPTGVWRHRVSGRTGWLGVSVA